MVSAASFHRISPICALFLLALHVAVPSLLSAEPACANAGGLLKVAASIRSLPVKQQVPCKVSNRDEVRKYLIEIIGKQLPPERLKLEEFVYKRLGLFPDGFDYQNGIIELYLSQIGAYYDPERDHYVMAGWLSSELQKEITVHELTHALQDQHYDLLKIIDYKSENGDQLLARASLVEGDATHVMLDHTRRNAGAKGGISDVEVEAFTMGGVLDATLKSSGEKAPRSLQLLLIFPYTSGLRFVHAITSKEGYAGLAKVYARPPSTSEEILHIDKYLAAKNDYVLIDAKDLRPNELGEGFSLAYSDTLGEFGISALLSGYKLKDIAAAEAAKGWGGDRIALFDDVNAGKRCIVWKTNWDAKEDAEEFFKAYLSVLGEKFPSGKKDSSMWSSSEGDVRASAELSGNQVTTVIYLDNVRANSLTHQAGQTLHREMKS